jgi:hypothetical protein
MSNQLKVPEKGPQINETKLVPFGYKLLGISQDIEEDNDVYKVKALAAEIAEIMKNNYEAERVPLKSLLFDHAVGEIINASMAVVKVLTFKNEE